MLRFEYLIYYGLVRARSQHVYSIKLVNGTRRIHESRDGVETSSSPVQVQAG